MHQLPKKQMLLTMTLQTLMGKDTISKNVFNTNYVKAQNKYL